MTASLALDDKGHFLALKVDVAGSMGAYLTSVGAFVPTVGSARTQGGAYRIPLVHYRGRAVFTHTAPNDVYRGAGRPEASYVIERLADVAAVRLGLDPAENGGAT